ESENGAWRARRRSRRMNIEWGSFLLVIQCLNSFDYTKRGYSIHLLSDCNLNKNTQNHGSSPL
ncbi:hypothetical protein, partial [Thiolapillus sp.]|uniref:hypothetical protein n=1 Tax=Thiolapillus sp. TaxID=2017437 RepID=UPI003AF9DB87